MKKRLMALWALTAFMLPSVAWAGVDDSVMKVAFHSVWQFLKPKVIPDLGHPAIAICVTALTLCLLLIPKQIRLAVGKLGGLVLAAYVLAMLFPLAKAALSIFLSLGILLIIVIGYLAYKFISIKMVLEWVKNLFSWTWDITTNTAKAKEPSQAMCWIGAIGLSGFLNSSAMSNSDTYYLPSIGLSIGGIVAVAHWWYKKTYGKEASKKFQEHARKVAGKGADGAKVLWDKAKPRSIPAKSKSKQPPAQVTTSGSISSQRVKVACPKCGGVNPPGSSGCGDCGVAFGAQPQKATAPAKAAAGASRPHQPKPKPKKEGRMSSRGF